MDKYQADFIQNNGTFLILSGQEENGFHSNRLNRIQCRMLASNKIPGLLDISVKELDFQASFHYEITGKKMLSEVIRSEQFDSVQFYGLLLQLASILADCKKYMLKPANFILDSSYIFLEGSLASGTIYLTYVPLADSPSNEGASSFLAFVMGLIPSVNGLEGTGLQKIIKMCASAELFSFTLMKELLLGLLEGTEAAPVQNALPEIAEKAEAAEKRVKQGRTEKIEGAERIEKAERIGKLGKTEKGGRADILADRAVQQPLLELGSIKGERETTPTWQSSSMGRDLANFAIDSFFNPERKSKPQTLPEDSLGSADSPDTGESGTAASMAKPKSTYIFLVAALLSAFGWKFIYLDHPGNPGLLGAAGITLVAAIGVLLLVTRNPLLTFPFKEKEGRNALDNWMEADSPEFVRASEDQHFKIVEYLSGPAQDNDFYMHAESVLAEDKPKAASGRTELLSAPRQATVLLGRSAEDSMDVGKQYGFLERKEKDNLAAQKIELKPGSFVIGRSADVVQFVENAAGTSRAHVEILVNRGQWQLKDLGSKNGTKLNGENMVPYKSYPLSPGDEFAIADANYKLHG